MLQIKTLLFTLLLLLLTCTIPAQGNTNDAKFQKADCDKIIINDSLIVNAQDWVLDRKIKIDINKVLLDSNNINTIYEIKNPCSELVNGYRGAYNIDRKVEYPLLLLSDLFDECKKENNDFTFYILIVNEKMMEEYQDYQIEKTKDFSISMIKDKTRNNTLTIIINQ